MTWKRFKQLNVYGIIFTFLLITCTPIMTYYSLLSAKVVFKCWSRPTVSEHTIAYNLDSAVAEDVYLATRKLLHAEHINKKVYIINAPYKYKDGSILKDKKNDYLGLYTHNVIVYDGTLLTLHHELAHFFFDKMNFYDQSESFAEATERYYFLAYSFEHYFEKNYGLKFNLAKI